MSDSETRERMDIDGGDSDAPKVLPMAKATVYIYPARGTFYIPNIGTIVSYHMDRERYQVGRHGVIEKYQCVRHIGASSNGMATHIECRHYMTDYGQKDPCEPTTLGHPITMVLTKRYNWRVHGKESRRRFSDRGGEWHVDKDNMDALLAQALERARQFRL